MTTTLPAGARGDLLETPAPADLPVEHDSVDATARRLLVLEMRGASQVEETRRDAAAWLAEVGEGDPLLRGRLELLVAVGDTRMGDFERGADRVRQILEWAAVRDDAVLLHARAERQLATLLRRAGVMMAGLEHAVASVDLLRPEDPDVLKADHVLGLADSLAVAALDDEALERYREALAIAERAGDPEFLLRVINNLTYTYYELDRVAEALPLCERMLTMRPAGTVLPLFALSTLADTFLAAGLPDRADEVLAAVVLDDQTPVEDVVDTLVSKARIQRAYGHYRHAIELLDRALAAAEGQGVGELMALALREQAELTAETGDFELAYRRFVTYHEQSEAQYRAATETREAMARAMFQITHARRESAAFRELSYRDALTELHNRRYVDEHLDARLAAAVDGGLPFTVAFLDLDHFKRVNDTWSHDVGDRVLQAVARLVAHAVADVEDGIAARMGGEEFLVALPGLEPAMVLRRLEQLRGAIRDHPWEVLAPGLEVTISIGVATSVSDATERLELLSTADRRLYDAKRAGRDRVVAHD